MSLTPTEILEHELPVRIRANNYLIGREPNKLAELLDIPPTKCLDFCREMAALAQSCADQGRLYPEKRTQLMEILNRHRVRILEEIFAEKQKHE